MIEEIFIIVILIFSAVLHEVAHGAMALRLGDPTAKYAGRLTLNPLKHLDLFGSVILPLLLIFTMGKGIAWAKPVPVNPYNFRDQKYGSAKVAFAGPASNLVVALFFGLTLRFIPPNYLSSNLEIIFSDIVFINLILAIFNLIPVPPLDGSHILFTFLPFKFEIFKNFLIQFNIFILLIIIFFLLPWLSVIVSFIFYLITGFKF